MVFNKRETVNLDYLRVIGSVTYAHIPKGSREPGKLVPTAQRLIMVGYSGTSKAYRLWDPSSDAVIE